MTTSGEDLERKYERLSEDYKKSTRYRKISANIFLAVFLIGVILFAFIITELSPPSTESTSADDRSSYMILVAVAFAGTVAMFIVSWRKANQFGTKSKEEKTGIMIYRAYRVVSDFINSNLKDGYRKSAKEALANLVEFISLWQGNAPSGLYEPLNELIKSMKGTVVQIIQNSKNVQEINGIRTFLHAFLATVNDSGINWNTIGIANNYLSGIAAPEPQEVSKTMWQTLRGYPNLKWVGIAVFLGIVVYFAMIAAGAESYFALGAAIPTVVGLIAGLPHIFKKT